MTGQTSALRSTPTAAADGQRADHVVVGAGPVGRALVNALICRGVEPGRIRVVSRSGRAVLPAGVQRAAGDAADPAFTTSVAAGARVVYQVNAPAYSRWAEEFPALQAGAIAAAQAACARLVGFENVYCYGAPTRDGAGTVPFTEDSPIRPCSRKGEVRARMHADLMAAHEAGRVEVAVGRASDYFGAGAGAAATNLGDKAMRAAATGGTVQVIGDADRPQTYSFIPDIGNGLAVLGEHPDAAGHVWHLPNDPDTRTTRQIIKMASALAGQGTPRLRRVPRTLMRVVGVVAPDVREVVEMTYQFEQPFVVESRRIFDRLGVSATPLADAVARTLSAVSERPAA